MAADLPGGAHLISIRGITAGIDKLGEDVLPAVVDASQKLDPNTLRGVNGRIDLAPIAAVAPELGHVSTVMIGVTGGIDGLPSHTWLSAADSARSDLLIQLTGLGKTLKSANLAAQTLPAMLGQGGTKRYFVGFQNEAEARGTGGLPGAFAIVSATDGKLRFDRFESDDALLKHGLLQTDQNFGADYARLYNGANTTSDYRNSNLSPNFPYAAQIWVAMWKKYSGQQLDGAIAVDPTALSYCRGDRPGQAARRHARRFRHVVALTQSTVYAKYPGTDPKMVDARKHYLLDVARATSTKVLNSHGNTKALVKAAGTAAGARRLLVWSADPKVQADIAPSSLSGLIPQTSAPYVGLSIVNDGGTSWTIIWTVP